MRSLAYLLCLALSACGMTIRPDVDPPPANLAVQCDPIQKLKPGSNMGDLVLSDIELAGQYRECSKRLSGLIEWSESATKKEK